MILSNWTSEVDDSELEVSLYSKGQHYIDLSIMKHGFGESIELTKIQVSGLIVALVEMQKEMV